MFPIELVVQINSSLHGNPGRMGTFVIKVNKLALLNKKLIKSFAL